MAYRLHPSDVRDRNIEWMLGPTPPLPRLYNTYYVGFDGADHATSSTDALAQWAAREAVAAQERLALVLAWPEDGSSLDTHVDTLERTLDANLGLRGRYACQAPVPTPEKREPPAKRKTPARSNAMPEHPAIHYDCKHCGAQWNQRTDGRELLCATCKHKCLPTWEGSRQRKIEALKERTKRVERRFKARGVLVTPDTLQGASALEMGVRIQQITVGAHCPLAPSAIGSVWGLTKAEEWLDNNPPIQ